MQLSELASLLSLATIVDSTHIHTHNLDTFFKVAGILSLSLLYLPFSNTKQDVFASARDQELGQEVK